jgi:hypothetical protein
MTTDAGRPSDLQPRVRGGYMRLYAAHVGRLPKAEADAILASIPAEARQAIGGVGLFGWLPYAVNLAYTQATSAILNETQAREFHRGLLVHASRSPLLNSLVSSVLRVTVTDPSLYLAWLPKGYALLFANVGSWHVVERRPGHAILDLLKLPSEAFTTPGWLQSVGGSLSGLGDLVDVHLPPLEVQSYENELRARFIVRWDSA